jgi:hypothetical protein
VCFYVLCAVMIVAGWQAQAVVARTDAREPGVPAVPAPKGM